MKGEIIGPGGRKIRFFFFFGAEKERLAARQKAGVPGEGESRCLLSDERASATGRAAESSHASSGFTVASGWASTAIVAGGVRRPQAAAAAERRAPNSLRHAPTRWALTIRRPV